MEGRREGAVFFYREALFLFSQPPRLCEVKDERQRWVRSREWSSVTGPHLAEFLLIDERKSQHVVRLDALAVNVQRLLAVLPHGGPVFLFPMAQRAVDYRQDPSWTQRDGLRIGVDGRAVLRLLIQRVALTRQEGSSQCEDAREKSWASRSVTLMLS